MKTGSFKLISIVLAILVLIPCLVLLWLMRPIQTEVISEVIYNEHLIAHAGGAIDGYTYTNSKEALLNSIDKGYKYIELDLFMTTDSQVVCLHSLDKYNLMTDQSLKSLDSETFKNSSLYGCYSTITLKEAIELWETHSFVFVTDKISDPAILNKYFVRDRNNVMVEAFSMDHYIKLKEDGYTPMLSVGTNKSGLLHFMIESFRFGCLADRITFSEENDELFLRIYKHLGLSIALYNINDNRLADKYLNHYVDYIYTDSLVDSSVPEIITTDNPFRQLP